jgi:hypothetical protein
MDSTSATLERPIEMDSPLTLKGKLVDYPDESSNGRGRSMMEIDGSVESLELLRRDHQNGAWVLDLDAYRAQRNQFSSVHIGEFQIMRNVQARVTDIISRSREAARSVGDDDEGVVDVTVLLPVFNGASFVAAAVRSILEQQGVDTGQSVGDGTITMEVLVLDDGSTDDSVSVVRAAAQGDNRVRLVQQSTNRGLVSTLQEVWFSAVVCRLNVCTSVFSLSSCTLLTILRAGLTTGSWRNHRPDGCR